jgi:hypothetical protein
MTDLLCSEPEHALNEADLSNDIAFGSQLTCPLRIMFIAS